MTVSDWKVAHDEANPHFVGWVVLGHRPLALSWPSQMEDLPQEGLLMYGEVGHIFPTYGEAMAAVERTEAYAKAHGYRWRQDMPLEEYRILNVGRIPTESERLARDRQIAELCKIAAQGIAR